MNRYDIPVPLLALLAGCGTWLITALGAAAVFLLRRERTKLLNGLMGFAAGVMLAASCWSLLVPAIELSEGQGLPGWLPAAVGFLAGAGFLWCGDRVLQRLGRRRNGSGEMLLTAITLHNVPEGLAVGVAFGILQTEPGPENLMLAFGVALGIGIQNYPEGAAVSLPLYRSGMSRSRSFLLAQATALVEPIAALLGALLVTAVNRILPWALAFAGGAMVLVAVHELIPECRTGESEPWISSWGVMLGFAVMMLLDVALG